MTVDAEKIRESIYALVRQNKVNSIIYGLVVPVLVGIFSNFYSEFVKINPLLFWAPVICFSGFAIFAAYITFDVKLAPEVYLELKDANETIDSLKGGVQYFTQTSALSVAWSAMIRGYKQKYDLNKTDTAAQLSEAISEICDVMILARDDLFFFGSGELWNFAVYLHNPTDGMLYAAWRNRHPRFPGNGTGRSWRSGEGHVGVTFAMKKTVITSDATSDEAINNFHTPREKPYDRQVYRSFISEPIMISGDRDPIGVLVATSDCVGRYNRGNQLVLQAAASTIATAVSVIYGTDSAAELARQYAENHVM